ncbi:MAG: hypothetical protein A2498_08000 [Lentisphaerae bacterium RIFOXYC12_FULL_60_16]|nr:MAG: hypothetical protein A2498_08000 [Lentisphaerae bacterium RIFOXYC12_FULL_60_16]OGV83769.1 MAG: hypothetical protein A2340_11160 [Lentisphaerae bacterium RIFOXYB12_FULL_60_10]
MTQPAVTRANLSEFIPSHDSFVGIDSDGCVFDTMEIKQKQCFHGLIASHWNLQPVEKTVRQVAEFTNLYSVWRGQNRFIALVKVFDLLKTHPDIRAAGITIPDFPDIRHFVSTSKALGNPDLERAARQTGSTELQSLLDWSLAVNARIEETVKQAPPFPWSRECLEKIHRLSDAICVSQTPTEALVREWKLNAMDHLVSLIAGQELGTKIEHIALATRGRYDPDRILMIGDAPGDLKAARENHALFYPINPAGEADSWEHFFKEGYDRFLKGTYQGPYEDALVAEFNRRLPTTPPWE